MKTPEITIHNVNNIVVQRKKFNSFNMVSLFINDNEGNQVAVLDLYLAESHANPLFVNSSLMDLTTE